MKAKPQLVELFLCDEENELTDARRRVRARTRALPLGPHCPTLVLQLSPRVAALGSGR